MGAQSNQGLSDESLSLAVATSICEAFSEFQGAFDSITRRAKGRFESRNLLEAQQDASERLDLYERYAERVTGEIAGILGDRLLEKALWIEVKARYSELIEVRYDIELAQTFYNSVTRRVHTTSGVDSGIEYYDSDFAIQSREPQLPGYFSYPWGDLPEEIFAAVLGYYDFSVDYADLDADCLRVVDVVRTHLGEAGVAEQIRRIDMMTPVFYRDGGAYLIGRIIAGPRVLPVVLSLRNRDEGIIVDAVLSEEHETSILFSFAHSYFFVAIRHHRKVIQFLRTIMPVKRVDELYASIGHHKHGKTELHRNLRWHLARTRDQFVTARGKKGMVMVVFTLPSYDVVFKVIRDRASPPKRTDKQRVMDGYELVFRHDRVGRLVDAQEFRNLEFRRERFEPDLLEELLEVAGDMVTLSGGTVAISHLYTERRITPLDVYVGEVDDEAARAAILDYGYAIRELAAANIFPGDLFLKNFGVTRHQRVVFYDYDELCLLSECNFRHLPEPLHDFQELEAETWFPVAENDIFPEEFRTFVGIPRRFMPDFEIEHADLFTPEFWREMKHRHEVGDIIEIFPYKNQTRLHLDIE